MHSSSGDYWIFLLWEETWILFYLELEAIYWLSTKNKGFSEGSAPQKYNFSLMN